MYSSARKLSILCFILSVANILGLIMVALVLIGYGLPFHELFTFLLYTITISITALLLTVAIRSTLQDMDMEYENQARQIQKLNERIEELEIKVK